MAASKPPILVVDDEPEILFSLRGLLRRDFEVHAAQSGAEALRILEQHPVHVILTDQRMPEMTGVELLSRARGVYPEAVRIVFTGYADIKSVVDAINKGRIYRYLTKPWDPDELINVLRQACEQHDQLAQRQQLLRDVREHLTRTQALLQGGLSGQAETALQVETSKELLARIERALAGPAEGPEG
jgi:response regulator RpfG family c-di-GMP phosphodiesterase